MLPSGCLFLHCFDKFSKPEDLIPFSKWLSFPTVLIKVAGRLDPMTLIEKNL